MAFHIYILLDTLVPASFLLIKILNVFQKVDSREESGQYLRAFAKEMAFISLVVSILLQFEKNVDRSFAKND